MRKIGLVAFAEIALSLRSRIHGEDSKKERHVVIMFRAVVGAAVISASSLFCSFASEAQFRTDYRSAAARLEQFYHSLSMRTETEEATKVGKSITELAEYDANGNQLRVIRTRPTRGNRKLVLVLTPKMSFELKRPSDQASFVLSDFRRASPEAWHETLRLAVPLAVAPFACLEYRIVDWLSQPGFNIREVRSEEDGDVKLSRVVWECVFDDADGKVIRVGEFVFWPSRSWALKEYAIGVPKHSERSRCVLEYDFQKHSEFPVIREARYWADTAEIKENVTIIRALDVNLKPADSEKFQLSAFGIPNRDDDQRSTWAFWCLVLGTIGLLVALLLRRWTSSEGTDHAAR